MSRYKKLAILAGALVIACAAAFGVTRYEAHKEQIKNTDEVILSIDPETVSSLSWEYEGNTLSFHKDETWLYDEDEAFPVDEEKIQQRLELFENFGAAFIIDDVEDYGQYGLDSPICTITLNTEEQTYEITVGDFSSMDSQRYVSIGDGKVYLVNTDPMDYFDVNLRDMIDHDETPMLDQADSIEFTGTESYTIAYQEEGGDSYRESDVYFAQVNGQSIPLDTMRVESYLQTIGGLYLSNYVTYNATEDQLKTYGLDSPDMTITIGYTAEDENGEETQETFVFHVSRDPEEKAAASEDQEDETITAYGRVGDSQIVYQLDSTDYESLIAASCDDLRHREVIPADLDDVKQVDVSLEGNTYTLYGEGSGDDRTWTYLEEELEDDSFQTALDGLRVSETEDFTDESPTGKEEISLTLKLDREDETEIHVALYRYDGSYCLAVVDGESLALIPRSDVVELMETVNAIVLN